MLFLAVVALLFFVVFPWLEPYLPFDRVSVDGSGFSDAGCGLTSVARSRGQVRPRVTCRARWSGTMNP